MSNRLVNLVDQARIGNTIAKAILRKIADQANDFGDGVWSSQEYLAWVVECQRQTVNRQCAYLRDTLGVLDWEEREGVTNLYHVNVDALVALAEPYKGRIDKMEAIIGRVKENDRELSVKMTGGVSENDTSPSKSLREPQEEVEEPVYVNLDKDDTPSEVEMQLDNFLSGWKYCFPDKAQPRRSSAIKKWKSRFRNERFRSMWRTALWQTKDLMWAHTEGWFKWQWFLHNDENFEKLLDGTFAFKGGKSEPQATQETVVERMKRLAKEENG